MTTDNRIVCSCGELADECDCEHRPYEDCMVCAECGQCDESLNDEDICNACEFAA